MKILARSCFLLLLTLSLCSGAVPKFSRTPVSKRIIRIDPKVRQVMFDKNKVMFEIVYGPTNVAQYAAEEMAVRLSKVLGVKITPRKKASGKLPAIIIGDAALAQKNGMDVSTLDRDGYFIRTVGRNIFITGSDDKKAHPRIHGYFERGSLFGVYEFLERFADVRYFFPGDMGIVTPRKTRWVLPGIDIADRPDSIYRKSSTIFGGKKEKRHLYMYKGMTTVQHFRDKEYQRRFITRDMHFTHGLAHMGLKERFAKTNPEFFALHGDGRRYDGTAVVRTPSDLNGQICFSDPGLKAQVIKDAVEWGIGKDLDRREWRKPDNSRRFVNFREPLRPFFCIMPNDCAAACACKGCSPHFVSYAKGKADKASSDFIWDWMIDIAEAVGKQTSEVYVTTMLYNPYHIIPARKIPENLMIRAAVTGPWAKGKIAAEKFKSITDLTKKVNHKIQLWTYMINAGERGIPEVPHATPAATGKFYKEAAPYIYGAFQEAEAQTWLFAYLNCYVFSKVMWDNSLDVDKLLADHDRSMFGPAAPQMKEIRESWERHFLNEICNSYLDTPLGPVLSKPSYIDVWEKIYSPQELKRISALFDRAEKAAAKDKECLARVKFIRSEIWQKVLDHAAAWNKQNDDRDSWIGQMTGCSAPVAIDGKLNEKDWQSAPVYYLRPREIGKKVNGGVEVYTKFRIMRDKEYFYIGIEADEPHTAAMVHPKRDVDDTRMWLDNLVELFFAPNAKSKYLYQFMITSSGQWADMKNYPGLVNTKWSSGMKFKTAVTPGKNYTVELRIPRKAMPELGDTFMFNITRHRQLSDAKLKVQTPFYTWSAFAGALRAEKCGIITNVKQPVNLVDDEDFSRFSGIAKGKRSGWNGARKVKVRFDRKSFVSGGASVIMDSVNTDLTQWFTQLKPDTRYRFSFYLKLENVKKLKSYAGVGVMLGYGNNKSFRAFPNMLAGNTPWRRYVFEVKTPAQLKAPAVWFYFRNASGRVLVDKVKVVEIK